ncbi:MAG: TM0996/MTH895 family glutaredoxin-like protein [Dehalococcoidia bacterium]|nr:TM0996/MTH895 family glutaredoxin-like protein [Dehalococcoidia bacterium]
MKIKVLGPGCSKCHQLEQVVREVVKELAVDASVEEVKDMKKIMTYPILMTPGLVINEELVCSGKVPSKAEVTQMIIDGLEKGEGNRKP